MTPFLHADHLGPYMGAKKIPFSVLLPQRGRVEYRPGLGDNTHGNTPRRQDFPRTPEEATSQRHRLSSRRSADWRRLCICWKRGRSGLTRPGRYEEGVGLFARPTNCWKGAQRRISLLSGLDSEGNPISRPMEDAASSRRNGTLPAPYPPRTRRREARPAGTAACGSGFALDVERGRPRGQFLLD